MNGLSTEVNALIARIYDDIWEDRPWIRSLESLREVVTCNTMAIEVADASVLQATYYFAAGKRVDASDIGVWEELGQERAEPIPFEQGQVLVYNDWRRESPNPGFLQLVEKYDVLRSMSVGILETAEGVRYSLHSGRSINAPSYSPWEQELFARMAGHFARAICLRLRMNQAETGNELQTDAMERLSVGGMIIDRQRRVLYANETARRLLKTGEGLAILHRQLRGDRRALDEELKANIAAVLDADIKPGSSSPVRAFAMPRSCGRGNIYLVLKKQRTRESISDRLQDVVQVYIHDPEQSYCQNSTIYQQLFKFTRTEATIASALANGDSVKAIEEGLGISHNTLRAHLRAIFSKTNVNSRAELVRVLTHCAAPLANFSDEERKSGGDQRSS